MVSGSVNEVNHRFRKVCWCPISINPRRFTWHKQALLKGGSWLYGTTWAGWGFWEWTLPFVGKVYSREEANALDDETLRINSVFRHNPNEMFTSNIVKSVQNNSLARGIPELSFPIGYTNVVLLNSPGNIRNFDMNAGDFRRGDSAWPHRDVDFSDDNKRPNRWLHTDLINVAHYYTHKLYEAIVTKGNMK